MPPRTTIPFSFSVALVATLALTWFSYAPGLAGGFLFDDFANLPAIGASGPVDNPATFWRYVSSGTADPTGRPIALLSFLIDANNWPAAPYSFKRTSVLLHMLNGMLLTWLLLKLGRSTRVQRAEMAAVLAAALWLLHPLLVSTTLYVVQREAMLPGTFILLGLIGFVAGRQMAFDGQRRGAWIAGASIATGTTLGILSKANGALLPLLAWLIEVILLAPNAPITNPRCARIYRRMRWLTLSLPSLILIGYLCKRGLAGFIYGIDDIRPWSLGERLLTEARIVVEYLGLLWLPRPYTAGLFNDAYPISTSLLSPGTTLPCILLIAGLIGTAVALRKRHPFLAVAVLFFFAAHVMESSVLPLELYFEHRNYVPAMLMFWPIALWLAGSFSRNDDVSRDDSRKLRVALSFGLVALLATLSWLRADLWGHPQEQALIWAYKNPDSPRAQAFAAQMEMARGQHVHAAERLVRALADHPSDAQLALNLIGARCATGTLSSADLERAMHALRSEPNTGRLGYEWFERSLPTAQSGGCAGMDLAALSRMLDAASGNQRAQKVPGRRQDVLHMQGRIALLQGNGEDALSKFDQALDADIRPGAALNQAAILGSAGFPRLALRHLDHFESIRGAATRAAFGMPRIHEWVLARQGYWEQELQSLKHTLRAARTEGAPLPSIDRPNQSTGDEKAMRRNGGIEAAGAGSVHPSLMAAQAPTT